MKNVENLFLSDLEKIPTIGDSLITGLDKRVYRIKYTMESFLKYNHEYFKKRGKKARIFLVVNKKKITKGGALEDYFKKTDETMSITVPYIYFNRMFNYLNVFKNKDAFVSTLNKMNFFIKKDGKDVAMNPEEKKIFKEEMEEAAPKEEKEEEKISLEEKSIKEEKKRKEMKIEIEDEEILKNTREYFDKKREEERENRSIKE